MLVHIFSLSKGPGARLPEYISRRILQGKKGYTILPESFHHESCQYPQVRVGIRERPCLPLAVSSVLLHPAGRRMIAPCHPTSFGVSSPARRPHTIWYARDIAIWPWGRGVMGHFAVSHYLTLNLTPIALTLTLPLRSGKRRTRKRRSGNIRDGWGIARCVQISVVVSLYFE